MFPCLRSVLFAVMARLRSDIPLLRQHITVFSNGPEGLFETMGVVRGGVLDVEPVDSRCPANMARIRQSANVARLEDFGFECIDLKSCKGSP
jgi:hypothetical protein